MQWLDAVAPRSTTTNFFYVGDETISYYAAGFSAATLNLLVEGPYLVPEGPPNINYFPYPSCYQQLLMGMVDDVGLDASLVIPAPIVEPGLDGTGNNCIVNSNDLVSPVASSLYYTLVEDVQNYLSGPTSGFPAHLYLQGQVVTNFFQQLTTPFWATNDYLWFLTWSDGLGQDCTTWYCQSDGVTQNVLDDLEALSNATVSAYMAGPMQFQPYGVGDNPFLYNVTDKVILRFLTTNNARVTLTLPAPTPSCIRADGMTVDSGYLGLLISACIGTLCTPSGDVATQYVAADLRKRSAQ